MLYINHSGKYIEINFNMKIPFQPSSVDCQILLLPPWRLLLLVFNN